MFQFEISFMTSRIAHSHMQTSLRGGDQEYIVYDYSDYGLELRHFKGYKYKQSDMSCEDGESLPCKTERMTERD